MVFQYGGGSYARAHAYLETIPQIENDFATSLVMGERSVEISGRYSPIEAPTRLDPIVLPDLRTPKDYATPHANTSAPS